MAAGHVAVVGAGLAGLSAALELQRLGFVVELFERSRLLGGKATSFKIDDVEVDNGQHVYLACCTEFIDFVQQLETSAASAGAALYLQDHFDALLLARGRPPARLQAARLPAPFHLAPALLRYRYLSFKERLQLAVAILGARRPTRPGETFAAWLVRHFQGQAVRQGFWEPFLVPALNAPLEEVAAEAALFVISTAFLGDAGAARFGFSRVPLARIAEAAAARIDCVHMRTPVVGVLLREGAGGPIFDGIVLDGGQVREYDAVVLAVPPGRVKRILNRPDDLGIVGLDGFRMAAIVDVHLWYDVQSVGFGFAALLDSPLQWVFEKGPGYVCCSMSAADRYVGYASADLVELCHRELAEAVPQLRGVPLIRGAATRDRDATFIPTPGLLRPGPSTMCQQVVIAGAWTDTGWPATMESAVRSGRAAARTLAAQVLGRQEVVVG